MPSVVVAITACIALSGLCCVHNKHRPKHEPFRRAYPIMGTILSISIWNLPGNRSESATQQAYQAVVAVDLAASTYNPNSELEVLHRQPRDAPVSISPLLHELLSASLELSKKTDGRIDVTVGPLIELWKLARPLRGEDHSIPTETAIAKAKEHVGYRKIHLEHDKLDLPVGMKLDFGGTGKGFALDQAAKVLRTHGVESASLSLGDQWLFLGHPPGGKFWKVDIRDPSHLDTTAITLEVPQGSVSTSAAYARYFTYRGKRYGHIIDPKDGWPSRQSTSVTVWAPTGIEADGYSTALFVAGPEIGITMAKKLNRISALWLGETNPQGHLLHETRRIR